MTPDPIPPQRPKEIYINYCDNVTDGKAKVLLAVCSEIVAKHKPDILHFLLSSNGGSVNAGIAIYNVLRALPTRIVMHNVGTIDSIATVIFLAGEERYAAKHSSFLFHGIMMNLSQGASLEKRKLKEILSGLEQDERKIAGIIASRCDLTEEEIGSLFLQGESKDLAFALEKRIIQKIADPTIPADAQIVSLNINEK